MALALLAGCAAPPTRAPMAPPRTPPGFPGAVYLQAAARGAEVFRIDPTRSVAVLSVYRAGPLASFGHDHVVASHDVRGYVLLTPVLANARADLYVPLSDLAVDEPALRAAAGFHTTPSASDIEGTRANMLNKVLEASRYPFFVLHAGRAHGTLSHLEVEATLTLHGMTRTLPLPVTLQVRDGELAASGRFVLRQSNFGITPFSILGGALSVRDAVDVRFDLHAQRLRTE